jgi:preprotein translocase subunit YajC
VNNAPFFIIILIAFGAMWLMSNRTRKQQRKAADFRSQLAVGQDVMTGSGMFGTVVAIDDDIITLESTPGSRSRWLRAAIAKVVEPPVEDPRDDELEVPDDLSTLPPARGDEDPEKK